MDSKIVGAVCQQCGKGKYVKSPKTGKIFCSEKCWLQQNDQFKPVPNRDEKIEQMYNDKKDNIRWQGAKNKGVDIALGKMSDTRGDDELQKEIEKWANFLYQLEPNDVTYDDKVPF
jgi:uncharacterized Zn finger protein (UPF0148 family)